MRMMMVIKDSDAGQHIILSWAVPVLHRIASGPELNHYRRHRCWTAAWRLVHNSFFGTQDTTARNIMGLATIVRVFDLGRWRGASSRSGKLNQHELCLVPHTQHTPQEEEDDDGYSDVDDDDEEVECRHSSPYLLVIFSGHGYRISIELLFINLKCC